MTARLEIEVAVRTVVARALVWHMVRRAFQRPGKHVGSNAAQHTVSWAWFRWCRFAWLVGWKMGRFGSCFAWSTALGTGWDGSCVFLLGLLRSVRVSGLSRRVRGSDLVVFGDPRLFGI